ncbi:disease resistance protein TAO1-like isoform X2 [Eucalyptus grandis]|uniref:disease resistance protein TAO1-like isoform X1 n=1 Tax=Eucalyptus grandis TaxID=71139 RepID=UPI00192EBD2B|nr:disease resistance protein TAO1-like isoform X1 [Eucalyptus grandis]XP_039160766.1 disease resistance protein TAO1-like isoform X2 [Eucalyptus grandis]
MPLLDCGSLDVRFLVVHGMGGIGKTTLAKAVFNEISSLFDGCSLPKKKKINSSTEFSRHSDSKYLLSLELCKSWLVEIPLNRFGQLENLGELTVLNCIFLVQLSCLSGLKQLRELHLLNCLKLVEIQGLVELETLESIRIGRCSSLVRLPNLLNLNKPRTIKFRSCGSLVRWPCVSRVAFEVCHLVIDRCNKLSNHNGPCWLYKDKRECPNP